MKTCTTSRLNLSHGLGFIRTTHQNKCTSYGSAHSLTTMSKYEETSTLNWVVDMASTGKQFMDRMEEYMELQDTPDFDVQQHLMELYEDLSSLYNDNNNE